MGKKSSNAKGKTCAWIYWFEILNEAEQVIIEKMTEYKYENHLYWILYDGEINDEKFKSECHNNYKLKNNI